MICKIIYSCLYTLCHIVFLRLYLLCTLFLFKSSRENVQFTYETAQAVSVLNDLNVCNGKGYKFD